VVNLLHSGVAFAVEYVLADARREQGRLLINQPDLPAQPLDVELLDVVPIKQNGAGQRLIEALDERDDGALAGPAPTDESDDLPGRKVQAEPIEDDNVRP